MKIDQAGRLKDLEQENARLKKGGSLEEAIDHMMYATAEFDSDGREEQED